MAYKDAHMRSIAKAFSWRLTGTVVTALIVYFFTHELAIAATVGGIEMTGKMLLYFFHERLWDRIHFGRLEIKPCVIWFTGLSGAGKSTVADAVYQRLLKMGLKVERLDGDTVRDIFPSTGFSREERDSHVRRVGYLASRLERNGVFVIASFISPYEESRQFVRSICSNFLEVYVSTPLAECERRDVKGLYEKARKGALKNFTGIDDPYEPPVSPDVVINTVGITHETAADKVMERLQSQIKLAPSTRVKTQINSAALKNQGHASS